MSSNPKLPRLGKGLEALIPKTFLASGRTITQIPIDRIKLNPYQPRKTFTEEHLISLSRSIQEHGLMQPIIVRKRDVGYELIAGERRLRACSLAKIESIPAIIKNSSDQASLQLALIENLEREDLNPLEVAVGFQRLIDEFGFTHQQIADTFKRSRSGVTNSLRLLKLPEPAKSAIRDGEISEGHARSLLSLKEDRYILAALSKIKKQGLNVRDIEMEVSSKARKGKLLPGAMLLFPELEKTLQAQFNIGLKIKGTRQKGKIEIPYSSQSELDEIVKTLSGVAKNQEVEILA